MNILLWTITFLDKQNHREMWKYQTTETQASWSCPRHFVLLGKYTLPVKMTYNKP